jgi:hypothetical protein
MDLFVHKVWFPSYLKQSPPITLPIPPPAALEAAENPEFFGSHQPEFFHLQPVVFLQFVSLL